MDVKQFTAGMVTDLTEKSQPPNTYRFALNAILEGRQGKLGSILSEEGNDTVVSVTAGHTVIGHVLTNTEDIILFTTDNTTSEIGIFNPDSETYTVIISETCLGFSTQHPIKALFRIRKGCERTIYFTDRVNPYRTINLDDLSQYQDTAGNIDCNKVAFTKPVSMPSLEIVQVNDFGGQLDVGSYQFAVRYLDTELNATNWFYTSNPVWIYDEGQDATYDAIDGAIPLVDNAEGVIGGVPATTKSIDLSISGLDTTYTYVQLAVLQSTATTGTISTIYVQPEIFIESLADNTLTYTYRGPDATSTTLTDLSDIVVDKLNIGVVQTHTQLDNRLWLAGISSTQYDYAALQRAANDITTS